MTGLETVWQELVFGTRRLVRSPTFALASGLTLVLVIGANGAIFAVIERVLLNPLPYPSSDRLIVLEHAAVLGGEARAGVTMTPGLYHHYLDRSQTLDSVAIYRTQNQTVTVNGEPERLPVARVTTTLGSVMGVSPTEGRWFSDAEGEPGAPLVAILGHGFWMRRYGGDPGVLRRSLTLNGVAAEIIGVMPASFEFPESRVELWVPDQVTREVSDFAVLSHRGVARLADGATVAGARAELTGLIADLPQAYPGVEGALTLANRFRLTSNALPLKEAMVGSVAQALWILFASVALLLLVACANVANLFLVRSEARQREVAVRRALGANRLRIARFFLAESAPLSAVACTLGLILAWAALRLLVAFGPASLPRLGEVRLDGMTVAFTLVVTMLVALSFGAIPLWLGTAETGVLQEGGRGNTAGRGRYRARQLLIGAQVSVTVVLLIACGLVVRSFQNLRMVDPGFDATSALTFRLGLPDREYPTRGVAVAAHQAVLDQVSASPPVEAVSATTCMPLSGGGFCAGNVLRVQGREIRDDDVPPPVWFSAVAGGYFEAMDMRLLRGRGIDRGDVERAEPIVVVNEALVDAYFPDQDPIGARIASAVGLVEDQNNPRDTAWMRIVGVVSNAALYVLAEAGPPMLYMPMSIAGGPDMPVLAGPNVALMSYVVRSETSPLGLLPFVRRDVGTIDSSLALGQVRTLQEMLDDASAPLAFSMVLLSIAAVVALTLSVVGIFGVTSYIASQRTGEIGVRLALGAEPGSIATMIVRQSALVALIGLILGLATALAVGRYVESLLYGVSSRDPGVVTVMSLTVLAVALGACLLPAWRAARVSPVDALRAD